MRWRGEDKPIPWRPPRAAWFGAILIWVVILLVASSLGAEGQVSADATVAANGAGKILVQNPRPVPVQVEIRVWESNEDVPEGELVELVREAKVKMWPSSFRLRPGGRRVVRLLHRGAYEPGEMLRVETLLTPEAGDEVEMSSSRPEVTTALRFRYRLITKLHVVGSNR